VHFARAFPRSALLLIDTYDTVAGARKVAALAPELAREGIAIRGVRLDSGDLAQLARDVRRVLDEAGLGAATIFASGNLDEYRCASWSIRHRLTPSASVRRDHLRLRARSGHGAQTAGVREPAARRSTGKAT
jgi:nicotinic acid phosphoribosyltransferase